MLIQICFFNADKPHNPMINSGAIMTAALIKPELSSADRFDFVSKITVNIFQNCEMAMLLFPSKSIIIIIFFINLPIACSIKIK